MGLIALIVAGVIIGVIARLLMPGRDPIGILGTVLVGIVGAIVGGLIGRLLNIGGGDPNALNIVNIILAIVGAIVVLLIARTLSGRRTV